MGIWKSLLVSAGNESTGSASSKSRTAEVGWLLDAGEARFLWSDPKRVRTFERNLEHSKAVNNCPAHLDYEGRLFEIVCPIDLRLRMQRDAAGRFSIVNLDGEKSGVRMSHLSSLMKVSPANEWRNPNRPIVQFVTPYVFIADEPVWLTQLPPVQHFQMPQWPGLLIGGRFPTDVWPRTLMWAFEWWNLNGELHLKRGDPWFDVTFETLDPSRPIRLVEAEMTPELQDYRNGMSSVTNYVNQTYALFKTARSRRPERLLKVKKSA